MFFHATINAALLLANAVNSISFDQCVGNKQNLFVPESYDKDVPDAYMTGNVTKVYIKYGIKQLRKVVEER